MTDIDLKDELNSLANILALDDFEAHAEIIRDAIKRIEQLECSIEFAVGIICGMETLFDKTVLKSHLVDEGKSMWAALEENK